MTPRQQHTASLAVSGACLMGAAGWQSRWLMPLYFAGAVGAVVLLLRRQQQAQRGDGLLNVRRDGRPDEAERP